MISLLRKTILPKHWLIFWIFATTLLLFLIGFFLLNPLWKAYGIHVPGEPNTKADFTFPVDGVFYIRNAELGYRWSAKVPTSIWFHPLVSWLIEILPDEIPANWRFYLINLASVPLSLFFVYKYAENVLDIPIKPVLIPFIVLIPGGLNMAIGNAETTALLFNTLVFIAIFENRSLAIIFLLGALAILTKPNALYLVAPLAVYSFYDFLAKDKISIARYLSSIAGILVGWLGWILLVDTMSGQFGTYWQARQFGSIPLYAGFLTLTYRTIEAISLGNLGESLKYITAFLIPIVDLWLALLIPFKNEKHRIASIAGIILLLLITFLISNPNKVIVYIMTLPSHLIIGFSVLQLGIQSFEKRSISKKDNSITTKVAFFFYILFSIGMCIFFIFGTAKEWYY